MESCMLLLNALIPWSLLDFFHMEQNELNYYGVLIIFVKYNNFHFIIINFWAIRPTCTVTCLLTESSNLFRVGRRVYQKPEKGLVRFLRSMHLLLLFYVSNPKPFIGSPPLSCKLGACLVYLGLTIPKLMVITSTFELNVATYNTYCNLLYWLVMMVSRLFVLFY